MVNTETTYMGLKLKSPIVVASSGLTNTISKLQQLENAGAGAVIFKSLFEEQIHGESNHLLGDSDAYPEAADYIESYVRQNSLVSYLDLVREAKREISIPIIASISCVSTEEWVSFAKQLEGAGADAIELNMFHVPTSRSENGGDIEQLYVDMLRKVKAEVSIPIAVKIGFYYTNIIGFVEQLMANGADSVTMFNRFYEPDINLKTLELTASEVFSTPAEIRHSLRWIGLTSATLPQLEIAASTGVHSGDAVIKQLLAGAQVVQVCSAVYVHGSQIVAGMNHELKEFMKKWNFKHLEDFRGRLSYKGMNVQMYERAQFMRYFSNHPMNF
ncbi:MAG: dihydroorotate dehydrogenase-like protein [Mangrovibacterium sp.]